MLLSQTECQALLEALVQPVSHAGEVIMDIHARGVVSLEKPDGSPVSEADKAAEAILLDALSELTPNIPVVSEENLLSHSVKPTSQFFLVDPLDGTKEFLRPNGNGAFTVNVGLIQHGRPVMGFVLAPALNRSFRGVVGIGAVEEASGVSRTLAVRDVPTTGPVAIASSSHRDDETTAWLIANEIRETRSVGSSLKFGLLAAGEVDVYPRFGPTMEWDTAAGDAVLRAAGGCCVFTDGTLFTYGKPEYKNTPFIATGDTLYHVFSSSTT